MTEAEEIVRRLEELLPHAKHGSLRFWGAWFGRPYDNMHEIVGCHAEGELLTLRFNEGELLRVWAPRASKIGPATFEIGDASRVRWEWFYYGRPKISANAYFEEFTRDGTQVRAESNADWFQADLQVDRSLPAVEIV